MIGIAKIVAGTLTVTVWFVPSVTENGELAGVINWNALPTVAAVSDCVAEIVETPVGLSSQSALILTTPAAVAVKLVVATPLAFVMAVTALNEPLPLVTVKLTVWPDTGFPPAAFALTVSVTGVPVLMLVAAVVMVSVDPVIGTSSVFVIDPAVALMLAVRLNLLAEPDE